MTYKILRTPEEVELAKIRNNLDCFKSHLWVTKDSVGHVWPFTTGTLVKGGCAACPDASFCRDIKIRIEKRLNGKQIRIRP